MDAHATRHTVTCTHHTTPHTRTHTHTHTHTHTFTGAVWLLSIAACAVCDAPCATMPTRTLEWRGAAAVAAHGAVAFGWRRPLISHASDVARRCGWQQPIVTVQPQDGRRRGDARGRHSTGQRWAGRQRAGRHSRQDDSWQDGDRTAGRQRAGRQDSRTTAGRATGQQDDSGQTTGQQDDSGQGDRVSRRAQRPIGRALAAMGRARVVQPSNAFERLRTPSNERHTRAPLSAPRRPPHAAHPDDGGRGDARCGGHVPRSRAAVTLRRSRAAAVVAYCISIDPHTVWWPALNPPREVQCGAVAPTQDAALCRAASGLAALLALSLPLSAPVVASRLLRSAHAGIDRALRAPRRISTRSRALLCFAPTLAVPPPPPPPLVFRLPRRRSHESLLRRRSFAAASRIFASPPAACRRAHVRERSARQLCRCPLAYVATAARSRAASPALLCPLAARSSLRSACWCHEDQALGAHRGQPQGRAGCDPASWLSGVRRPVSQTNGTVHTFRQSGCFRVTYDSRSSV